MQRKASGFRQCFQDAEGQRDPAVMAEGKVGSQLVCSHPVCSGTGELIRRGTAFQPHGLDVPQAERLPQAGACRLEKGLLGGKVGGAGQPVGCAAPGGQGKFQCQSSLLGGAEHPPHKGICMSAGQAFFQMCQAAYIAADAVNEVPFKESIEKATRFAHDCVQASIDLGIPRTDGLAFEEKLHTLTQ